MIDISAGTKKLYMNGITPKHLRILFPDGDFETIENDKIVAESLEFRENLVQGEFKFGLCQANYFSVQIAEKIDKNVRIQIEIGVEDTYISLGEFTVGEVKKDNQLDLWTIEGYGKAMIEKKEWASIELWKRSLPVLSTVKYETPIEYAMINQKSYPISNLTPKTFSRSISTIEFWKNDMIVDGALRDVIINYRGQILLNWSDSDLNIVKIGYNSSVPDAYKALVNSLFSNNQWDYVHWAYGDFAKSTSFGKDPVLMYIVRNRDQFAGYSFDKNTLRVQKAPLDVVFSPYINGRDTSERYGEHLCVLAPSTGEATVEAFTCAESGVKVSAPRGNRITAKSSSSSATATAYYVAPDDENNKTSDIINDFFELNGLLGRAKRNGDYEFFEFGEFIDPLYPSDNIFPDDNLYMIEGNSEIIANDKIERVEFYEDTEEPFGAVFYDYIDTNNQKAVGLYQFDARYNKAYYLQNNKLIADSPRTQTQINATLDAVFIPKLRKIKWAKFKADTVGMPWLESGDRINVVTQNKSVHSYVFNRTLKGIQALMDEIDTNINYSDVNAIATTEG
ncbi:unnamed protein product [Cylicocyclus nassatus]|uniref:Uncharacterized protein n=1 Tax=Cylicocyclus nassatus TaxID=53992 RepID=A0AA36GQD4_CYLNA|nr:unnamed protein product [Cylicocyclus nassatus]